MFVAYLSSFFKRDKKEPKAEKKETELDEFGDLICDENLTPAQRRVLEDFDDAVNTLPKIVKNVPEDMVLRLYALYKVATVGPADPSNRPSMLDLRGRTKFDAWSSLGQMDKFEAMVEYATHVGDFNISAATSQSKSTQGFGLKPSTMQQPESEEDFSNEPEADWFNAIKNGNLQRIEELVAERPERLEVKDVTMGMTALLWATDSGSSEIVKLLLSKGAAVNSQDNDGNTPLHLANFCGHEEICSLLIDAGADCYAHNKEGQQAVDFLLSEE